MSPPRRRSRPAKKFDQTNFNNFIAFVREFQFMASLEPPLLLPPNGSGQWRRMGEALLDAPRANGAGIDNTIRDYAKMSGALAANSPDEFNSALRDLRSLITSAQPKAIAKARAETFFNQMEPFYNAMVIYVLAGLLACFSWFNLSETLRRSAVWLIALAFVIHTVGLVYRMVLEGRPPVTNLYSSAIFIGWGAVLLGLILEKFHKNGIGAVVASGIGFITLIIAHHLALEGDTMEMMRAVLDTNFWLATHVVAVTVGYASTFVAGFLALIYVLRGMFTRTLDEATGKSLARMIYGIVCFATLFSFVGTVLGGIWADQSWGRFWGWDPEGKRRAHHRVVERAHFAFTLGRTHPRARTGELRHLRQRRHGVVVVWGEHAGHRAAQLRVHGSGLQMAGVVCGEPAWLHRARFAAGETVEKFQGADGVRRSAEKPQQDFWKQRNIVCAAPSG